MTPPPTRAMTAEELETIRDCWTPNLPDNHWLSGGCPATKPTIESWCDLCIILSLLAEVASLSQRLAEMQAELEVTKLASDLRMHTLNVVAEKHGTLSAYIDSLRSYLYVHGISVPLEVQASLAAPDAEEPR